MSVTLFPTKITSKTMLLGVKQLSDVANGHKDKPVQVLRVWGTVSGVTSKNSSIGTSLEFKGEIAAQNLVTGEEARSQKLFLPACAEMLVESLFQKCVKNGGSSVQFGLDLTVEYNPASASREGTPYKWGVKPLVEVESDDILSLMAKEFPPVKLLLENKSEPQKATKKK